jgi:hypothetical protein
MNGRIDKSITALASLIIVAGISSIIGCAHIDKNNINLPGRSTTYSKCGACHVVPEARNLKPDSLEEVLTMHSKWVRLTTAEIENIRLYLLESENQKDKLRKK